LAEPRLKGLMFSGHLYRFSGTAQIRDSTILVCIPSIWYDDWLSTAVAARDRAQRFMAVKETDENRQASLVPFL
jgi:hypothetical protein